MDRDLLFACCCACKLLVRRFLAEFMESSIDSEADSEIEPVVVLAPNMLELMLHAAMEAAAAALVLLLLEAMWTPSRLSQVTGWEENSSPIWANSGVQQSLLLKNTVPDWRLDSRKLSWLSLLLLWCHKKGSEGSTSFLSRKLNSSFLVPR